MHDETNRGQGVNFRRHRLSEGGRKESLDFNAIVTPEPSRGQPVKEDPAIVFRAQGSAAMENQEQTREEISAEQNNEVEDMQIDSREQAPAPPPALPDGALRTRYYRLNLDSEAVGLSSSQRQQMFLGPFAEPPPYLTYSSSSDSSEGINATKVAIKTAQIFRGITVGRDGTILSQNARATRSSRGNKTKRGEKSRQAAKIDKAKDLVEEAMATSAAKKDSDDPPNMVSLVIMGEYDDMKHLVRDGSKKLREADGLSDKTLLSLNQSRTGGLATPTSAKRNKSPSTKSSSMSRKRSSASPNYVHSQRSAAMAEHMQTAQGAMTSTVSPPKLKGHPRDTRPTRREDRTNMRMKMDSVNDYNATHAHHNSNMDTHDPTTSATSATLNGAIGNNGGHGNWSQGWNLWNCVGSGAVSPLQPSIRCD